MKKTKENPDTNKPSKARKKGETRGRKQKLQNTDLIPSTKEYKKEYTKGYFKQTLVAVDYSFLNYYAQNHDKMLSAKLSGLDKHSDGSPLTPVAINKKTYHILKNPESLQFVKDIQKQIFESNCHSLEKAVDESYNLYLKLVEVRSFHSANAAYDRYCMLLGLLGNKNNNTVSVNTQIVGNDKGGITINYITPKNNNDDGKNIDPNI